MAKVAIVTGASRGIGRATAKRLAKDGFSVVVNYAGDAAMAQGVVNEIKEGGLCHGDSSGHFKLRRCTASLHRNEATIWPD